MVQDLLQATLLCSVLTARRHNVTDSRQLARIAQRIARGLIVDEHRRSVRIPETNYDFEETVDPGHEGDLATARDELIAIREQLEKRVGRRQGELLAAVLDRDITNVNGLAVHLATDRANVRRMLAGIAKQVRKLGFDGEPD